MADLTGLERRAFERLLGMVSGYVLEFSKVGAAWIARGWTDCGMGRKPAPSRPCWSSAPIGSPASTPTKS